MADFTGKTIIVTGAASGIGNATAQMLLEAGANVVLADRDESAVLGAALRLNNDCAFAVRADVTSEADVKTMINAAIARFGKLDGACNAAGVAQVGKQLHEIAIEEWDRCHQVNLRGTFLCNKHQILALLESGGGAIVNIVSTSALVGFPNGSEYCASKAGVLGLVRAGAIDYATKGIRINAVLPGATATPMLMAAFKQDPGLEAALASVHPMGRLATPVEIAGAARWLLSDEASFVTGTSYAVDGGHTSI